MNKSKRTVLTLSLSHMLNDWYMNFIQTLLPFFVLAGLSVSKGALLVSLFTLSSSIIQPLFGVIVDRKNQRWLVYAGTLWMSVLLGLLGLIKSYPLMLAVVTLAGLGTAAFHPQASAMVNAASGERKGFYQAVFIAMGNVGWALTPLVVIPLVYRWGIEVTPVIPGVLAAVLLLLATPAGSPAVKTAPMGSGKSGQPIAVDKMPGRFIELSKIVGVVVTRSVAYFGLVAFLPLYFQARNYPVLLSSKLLFIMLFTGALGGLVGGYVSDLMGRKAVITTSLFMSSVFFYLFMQVQGPAVYLFLALAGASLLASFSVTVVAAQEILKGSTAVAAGLIMGFGIGMGGLGVGLLGIPAEIWGLESVISILIWFPALAGIIALTMKKNVSKKMAATSLN